MKLSRLFFTVIFILGVTAYSVSKKTHSRLPAGNEAENKEAALDTDLGETLWPDEETTNEQIVETISKYISRRYSEGRRPAIRDAHAKAHGCVKAVFTVKKDLAPELSKGAFIPGKQYKAWIRFSNGFSEIADDKDQDARGMAIKLTGVAGEKILAEESSAQTQDFIMINHPMFFVDNPAKYLATLGTFHKKLFSDKTNEINKLLAVKGLSAKEATNALKINGTKIANPLEAQYWSMVPYRLGVDATKQAIKFTAKPCTPGKSKVPGTFSNPDKDYLKLAMKETLASEDGCFNFYIQTFKDFKNTPIEHSTVEWKESVSAPVLIANIRIPVQKFDSDAQTTFCENLSFTPWHSLPSTNPWAP